EHVRDRLFPPAPHRIEARPLGDGPPHHHRLRAAGRAALRPRGARAHRGRGPLPPIAGGPRGEPRYALEGSVFIAGAAVQWLRDGLGVIETAAESEALARSVPDAGG